MDVDRLESDPLTDSPAELEAVERTMGCMHTVVGSAELLGEMGMAQVTARRANENELGCGVQ